MNDEQAAAETLTKKVYEAGDSYPLRYPVEVKTAAGHLVDTITSVTFRRLNGSDLTMIANSAAKGQGAALKCIVCLATGISPTSYDRMDAADLTEVGAIASGFIGSGLPTGAM